MGKLEIRQKMAALRDRLDAEEAKVKDESILGRLTELEEYKSASIILTYVSFRSEVSTMGLIQKALSEGRRIAVPVCIPDGKELLPCEIHSLDDLKKGTWGILEPPVHARSPIDVKEIDLAIVPGLAFDKFFNRLGYGAGYYDRFLPKMRADAAKVGICYEFQLLDQLPADPFDIPMDSIVTESSILRSK